MGPHQLHEVLATLWSDDPQVRFAAVDHLRAGWRWRLSRDYFPEAVAIGYGQEAWRGPGTDVAISWRDTNKEWGLVKRQVRRRFCVFRLFWCFQLLYLPVRCTRLLFRLCLCVLISELDPFCCTTSSSSFLQLKQSFLGGVLIFFSFFTSKPCHALSWTVLFSLLLSSYLTSFFVALVSTRCKQITKNMSLGFVKLEL